MKAEAAEHLERAQELLRASKAMLDIELPSDAINRSYYAMFHAAKAILTEMGVVRSSHRGVIAAFGQYVVKHGHMQPRFHASLRRAFNARVESDYLARPEDTMADAAAFLRRAREFLAAARTYLERSDD
ncbi:MAG: HEPN domain-containing protein [Planctomycetota bacterium]